MKYQMFVTLTSSQNAKTENKESKNIYIKYGCIDFTSTSGYHSNLFACDKAATCLEERRVSNNISTIAASRYSRQASALAAICSASALALAAIAYASASPPSRRPLLACLPPIRGIDRDYTKYVRRSTAEILSRWSRRFYAPSSRPPWRRAWFLVLCGILAFVVLVYLNAALGRGGSLEFVR
uniref:Uncharacterized protein n=1 Tax=Glossina brevipalpis TaxID=37001 RepID=A0A1A9WQH2_9MUSC